jgi:hypothetical protein
VFKHLRQINPDRGAFVDRLAYSLLDLQTRPAWGDLPAAALPADIPIGQPYLVGAGAVGQAFALALGSVPGVRGHVTAIDPESLDDITNLNRYPLARRCGRPLGGHTAGRWRYPVRGVGAPRSLSPKHQSQKYSSAYLAIMSRSCAEKSREPGTRFVSQ